MAADSIGNPYRRKVFSILDTQTNNIELVTSKKKLWEKIGDWRLLDKDFEMITTYNALINIMRRGLQWEFTSVDEYEREHSILIEQHEI